MDIVLKPIPANYAPEWKPLFKKRIMWIVELIIWGLPYHETIKK